jgi:hypothetical protein
VPGIARTGSSAGARVCVLGARAVHPDDEAAQMRLVARNR